MYQFWEKDAINKFNSTVKKYFGESERYAGDTNDLKQMSVEKIVKDFAKNVYDVANDGLPSITKERLADALGVNVNHPIIANTFTNASVSSLIDKLFSNTDYATLEEKKIIAAYADDKKRLEFAKKQIAELVSIDSYNFTDETLIDVKPKSSQTSFTLIEPGNDAESRYRAFAKLIFPLLGIFLATGEGNILAKVKEQINIILNKSVNTANDENNKKAKAKLGQFINELKQSKSKLEGKGIEERRMEINNDEILKSRNMLQKLFFGAIVTSLSEARDYSSLNELENQLYNNFNSSKVTNTISHAFASLLTQGKLKLEIPVYFKPGNTRTSLYIAKSDLIKAAKSTSKDAVPEDVISRHITDDERIKQEQITDLMQQPTNKVESLTADLVNFYKMQYTNGEQLLNKLYSFIITEGLTDSEMKQSMSAFSKNIDEKQLTSNIQMLYKLEDVKNKPDTNKSKAITRLATVFTDYIKNYSKMQKDDTKIEFDKFMNSFINPSGDKALIVKDNLKKVVETSAGIFDSAVTESLDKNLNEIIDLYGAQDNLFRQSNKKDDFAGSGIFGNTEIQEKIVSFFSLYVFISVLEAYAVTNVEQKDMDMTPRKENEKPQEITRDYEMYEEFLRNYNEASVKEVTGGALNVLNKFDTQSNRADARYSQTKFDKLSDKNNLLKQITQLIINKSNYDYCISKLTEFGLMTSGNKNTILQGNMLRQNITEADSNEIQKIHANLSQKPHIVKNFIQRIFEDSGFQQGLAAKLASKVKKVSDNLTGNNQDPTKGTPKQVDSVLRNSSNIFAPDKSGENITQTSSTGSVTYK